MAQDDLMSMAEIARFAGVTNQTAGRWDHPSKAREAVGHKGRSPLQLVAERMGVELSAPSGHYPRSVVRAFLKAVGYMGSDGRLIPEVQAISRGRWVPVRPTLDPVSFHVSPDERQRLVRFYVPHAAQYLGMKKAHFEQARARGGLVPEDGYDEMSRPFWYEETLREMERERVLRAARADGFDSEGRLYRLLPTPDGYDDDGRPYQLVKKDTAEEQAEEPGEGE